MALIEAPIMDPGPGRSGLVDRALSAGAQLVGLAPLFDGLAERSRRARDAGAAQLAAGHGEAGSKLSEAGVYDPAGEGGDVARALQDAGWLNVHNATTPTPPGGGQGPPPGDYMYDNAENQASGLPGEADRRAGQAPRPEDPQGPERRPKEV